MIRYRVARCYRLNWRDLYRYPLAWMLLPLIVRDYALREMGQRPDKWYWADVLLLRMGYAVKTVERRFGIRRYMVTYPLIEGAAYGTKMVERRVNKGRRKEDK